METTTSLYSFLIQIQEETTLNHLHGIVIEKANKVRGTKRDKVLLQSLNEMYFQYLGEWMKIYDEGDWQICKGYATINKYRFELRFIIVN